MCSCANYFTAENNEIDRRSLEVIEEMVGMDILFTGLESGVTAVKPYVRWVQKSFYLYDMYHIWVIQAEVAAKYKHCHQKFGI